MIRTFIAGGILAPAILLLLASPDAGAQPLQEKSLGPVTVRFVPGAKGHADSALANAADALRRVPEDLGVPGPATITVTLVDSASFKERMGSARGEWAAGAAFSPSAEILINIARLDLVNDLYTTLRHEVVHLVLGRLERETGRPIPLWFHEGIAQRICQKLFQGSREAFLAAVASDWLYPLADLEETFPNGAQDAEVAYAQSESFLAFLDDLAPFSAEHALQGMRRGLAFDEALRLATGRPFPEIEKEWRDRLSSGPPFLVAWLLDSPGALTILILAIGGLLLTAAFVRHRLRRRELMRKWEREEEWE